MTDKLLQANLKLTQSRVKEVLSYCMETGVFTWAVKKGKCRKGDVAGRLNQGGYIEIKIDYVIYKAHRLAYLYVTGDWPTDEIDHINHIKDDNKWSNLKGATHKENGRNHPFSPNNTSGFTGVNRHKRDKTWQASIKVNGSSIHLGCFKEKCEAIAARVAANIEYGFHENHGKAVLAIEGKDE